MFFLFCCAVLSVFLILNHLAGEEGASCFNFIAF